MRSSTRSCETSGRFPRVLRVAWILACAAFLAAGAGPARGGDESADEDASLAVAFILEEDIGTVPAGGGAMAAAGLGAGEKANLAVSPDLSVLAYVHLDPEEAKYKLALYRFPERTVRVLCDLQWQPPRPLAFSPDGRWIAVVDAASAMKHEVVLVSVEDGTRRVVVSGADLWDGPVFSGTGALAWSTVMDAQYTGRLLTRSLANGLETKIRVSARMSEKKTAGRSRDADNPAPLSVSPDGRTALWLDWGARNPTRRQLVVVDLGGGGQRWVTDTEKGCLGARFSPDGKRIAYVALAPERGKTGIYVCGRAGEKPELVATFVRQPYRGWMCSWSPDGRFLVWAGKEASGLPGHREVYRVTLETKAIVKLTDNDGSECYPVWVRTGIQTGNAEGRMK